MNTLERLNYLKIQQTYGTTLQQSFNIEGILQEKDQKNVKVQLRNRRIVEAVLKSPIEGNVGDKVVIDKSQVVSMKVLKKAEENSLAFRKDYSEVLQSYGIKVTEEALEAAKTLDLFNIPITKEGVGTLMTAKNYLDTIQHDLNYDTAVKLLEKEVDLEHSSLYEIVEKVKEIKEEKKAFSLLKFLGIKKEMTTEEAERIAREIYGSSMGKDITDIIKSLHQAKTTITKKNIEAVYEVFYKLGKLKGIEDESFVKLYKQGEVFTLESLYNMKYAVKEGVVPVEEGIQDWAVKLYERHALPIEQVTEKDLKRLEGQILSLLREMRIDTTRENRQLANALIQEGIPLTKEHMQEIVTMKEALKTLMMQLDLEKASELIRLSIDIEKQDIRQLVKWMQQLPEDGSQVLSQEVRTGEEREAIQAIYTRLEQLKEIRDIDLVKLLKGQVDFQLHKIEKVIFHEKGEKEEADAGDQKILEGTQQILSISGIFNKVKQLSIEQILYHKTHGVGMTLRNIERIHETIKERNLSRSDNSYRLEAYAQYQRIRSQLTASMVMDSLKEGRNLEGMPLKDLDYYINEKNRTSIERNNRVEEHIFAGKKKEKKEDGEIATTWNAIKKWVDPIRKMGKEKDVMLPLLMKNKMVFSLKEIGNLSLFLKNQQQLGDQIGQLVAQIGSVQGEWWKTQIQKLEELSQTVFHQLKSREPDGKACYRSLVQHIDEMEKEMNLFQDNTEDEQARREAEALIRSLRMQKKLNKSSLCFQFPIVMGDQFKNLQVYVLTRDDEKRKAKQSMLLNLNTNSLGSIQILVEIKQEKVMVTIGVQEEFQRRRLEKYIPLLEELLQEEKYILEEISFKVEKQGTIVLERGKKALPRPRGVFDRWI
jgi:hypothetical protein